MVEMNHVEHQTNYYLDLAGAFDGNLRFIFVFTSFNI
jgi:hypothetical protein